MYFFEKHPENLPGMIIDFENYLSICFCETTNRKNNLSDIWIINSQFILNLQISKSQFTISVDLSEKISQFSDANNL